MQKINFALIGAGFIAEYHARGLQAQESVEIVAVCGLPQESARTFAEKYGVDFVTEDALSLVDRDDIDAVILALPNKFHAPYAIEFLKNGKDVFIEKPMAMNVRESELIAAVAEENHRIVMVGHMWRFDEEVNFIKNVVASGKIGRIIKTKGYGIHENWGPEGWFVQKEMAGGGALADMGVHAIDTVRYILGDPLPKQVYAKIGTFYGNYDVDDTGILMISWDNGTTSVIESGWRQPHADGPEAATRLFGTQGYAGLFPTLLKLKIADVQGEFNPQTMEKTEHCDQSIYTRQMEHFVNCVRTRQRPQPGFREGRVVLQIVDAAYRSSETGQAVEIP